MRLRGYKLKAEHVPGKLLIVPDTLSRSPVNSGDIDESSTVGEIECYFVAVDSLRPLSDRVLRKIRAASERDSILQEAMNYTRFGWSCHVSSVRNKLRDLSSRSELSISHGLLLYRDRIAIPVLLRPETLESIHEDILDWTSVEQEHKLQCGGQGSPMILRAKSLHVTSARNIDPLS
jgi:hypothetical protein